MDMTDPLCTCHHHRIAPIALVLIGLDFLANALGLVSDGFLAVSWPILLVVAGLAKLLGRTCRCCRA